MPTNLGVTNSSLKYEVGRLLHWGPPSEWTAEDNDDYDAIKIAALQQFYWPPATLTGGTPHTWSFLEPTFVVVTNEPYTTGTVEIASGVVTLTGGTFPAWAEYAELEVDNSAGGYRVASRDTDTQITLEDLTVAADALSTYALTQYRFSLPTDFGGQRGPLTYRAVDSIDTQREVAFVPYDTWRHYKQNWSGERDEPRYATIALQRWMDTTTIPEGVTDLETYELMLWPTPDASYRLSMRYSINPNTLDSNDILGGDLYPAAIRLLVLAEAERSKDHPTPKYQQMAIEQLLTAIRSDKTRYSSSTVGYIGDDSDRPEWFRDDIRWTVTHENQS